MRQVCGVSSNRNRQQYTSIKEVTDQNILKASSSSRRSRPERGDRIRTSRSETLDAGVDVEADDNNCESDHAGYQW